MHWACELGFWEAHGKQLARPGGLELVFLRCWRGLRNARLSATSPIEEALCCLDLRCAAEQSTSATAKGTG
jgi:hypothetical protein